MILVDSNILIDLTNKDSRWFEWSSASLRLGAVGAEMVVNPIVVGEVAPLVGSLERFTLLMVAMLIRMDPLPIEAGFHAGEAFQRYLNERRRSDQSQNIPKSILADFLIGGHAEAVGATILTRDPRRYRRYFEAVPLITPERTDND